MAKKLFTTYISTIELNVDEIKDPPFLDRSEIPEKHIDELTSSIKQHGLIRNIWVRPDKINGGYIRVAGRCRIAALKRLDIQTVNSDVFDVDEDGALSLATIENDRGASRPPLDQLRSLLHQISLRWRKMLQKNNAENKKELLEIESFITLANMVHRAIKDGIADVEQGNVGLRMLYEAAKEVCNEESRNLNYLASQLTLFELPPAIQRLVNNGQLSLRSGMTCATYAKKIKGRREKISPEQKKKLAEFMSFVSGAERTEEDATYPDSSEIRKRGEIILAGLAGVNHESISDRYENLQKILKKGKLSPRDAHAVDTLLKKIEKIVKG